MPIQRGQSLGVGAPPGGRWGVAAWVPGQVPQLEELAHSILVTGTFAAVLDFHHLWVLLCRTLHHV